MRLTLKLGFLGIILAAAFYYLLLPNFSVTAGTNAPQPLWEIDLTKYGYQGRPPILLGNADAGSMSWTYKQAVFFTEPDVVGAFFVVRDQPPNGSAEQSKASPSDSFRLEIVFFNVHKGEYLKKLEWLLPTDTRGFLLFPATNGQFIIGIGSTLSLYSPDTKIIAQHTVQREMEGIASPSGEKVLLWEAQRVEGQWIQEFDLLETKGLTVLKSWKSAPQMNQILWGDEIGSMIYPSISIMTPDTAAKALVSGQEWFCPGWSFINKETIAMCQQGPSPKLSLVSPDGK